MYTTFVKIHQKIQRYGHRKLNKKCLFSFIVFVPVNIPTQNEIYNPRSGFPPRPSENDFAICLFISSSPVKRCQCNKRYGISTILKKITILIELFHHLHHAGLWIVAWTWWAHFRCFSFLGFLIVCRNTGPCDGLALGKENHNGI